jgi:predicted PilT family ATPase
VTGEENDQSEGLRRFAELQRILAELGHAEMAAQVSMSVFKPRTGDLWVRVPEQLKPRFIGKQGSTIKEMQRRLGLTIKLERL